MTTRVVYVGLSINGGPQWGCEYDYCGPVMVEWGPPRGDGTYCNAPSERACNIGVPGRGNFAVMNNDVVEDFDAWRRDEAARRIRDAATRIKTVLGVQIVVNTDIEFKLLERPRRGE